MSEKFEKIMQVRLPFDRRAPAPQQNFGIGGFQIKFILKGPRGAIQFMIGISAYLPHVLNDTPGLRRDLGEITGWDVGYHSYTPKHEGQQPTGPCEFLEDSKVCYYDGSALHADDWVKEIFSVRGEHPDKLMWQKLENEYYEVFEQGDA